ncbi:MAG: phosphoribosylamine--glycine ligase [Planctomycetia bacterium]|nr:phosphoribosylamine--glycine ligase [Planctomycetia bacterium]
MNILVVGSGGREHALAWKLKQSPRVEKVFIAPGNAGTEQEGENVPIDALDFPRLIEFAKSNKVGLTVVGPEAPLSAGIVDAFKAAGLKVFGPSKKAAQLEASKVFCKEILVAASVPTALYRAFNNERDAVTYLRTLQGMPVVIKADGLAAGKGVIVCDGYEDAVDAVHRLAADREFGDAGNRFIIEERLSGQEASVLAITDGKTIMTLQPAQDHKAAHDGDTGPNTGGMGAYCPAALVDDAMLHWIEENVLVPTVHTLNRAGTPFTGILYAGLMLTPQGPRVLEYNVRFGDPECQPLLFRLKTDLVDVLEAAADGRLDQCEPLEWDDRGAVCVVMASEGYPGSYRKGYPISGLEEADALPNVKVFHAGTNRVKGNICNNGGRVLDVTALGATIAEAKKNAYEAVSKISWHGSWCRSDISDKNKEK